MSNQIKVIFFISLGTERTNIPIDKDFMCDSNVPKELLDVMIENGWVSDDGMNDWDKDFQPLPVKDNNNQKWLMLNDRTLKNKGMSSILEHYEGMGVS